MKSAFVIAFLIFIGGISQDKWKAPPEADKLKNPVAGQQEAIKGGKKIFATMCAICHGEKGKGDGVAGAALNPKPTNLITGAFHAQSDGAIFWKITEGRAPMASYKATLTEEKRWQLVSYLRTLKQ
ncbi:cytochrome c [Ekhidna sp.]|jgi:mono/diheme cytochrome c family protein|uniref:c-type cytochrome n=1 Tax=Ekhidna sp. TaxID=2608089 RepID=UPI0032EE9B9C